VYRVCKVQCTPFISPEEQGTGHTLWKITPTTNFYLDAGRLDELTIENVTANSVVPLPPGCVSFKSPWLYLVPFGLFTGTTHHLPTTFRPWRGRQSGAFSKAAGPACRFVL
jgi:hypothetical protein